MQGWQTTYLGMRELPRDISGFELQAFFTFSPAELALIDARRGDAHKLGLALHIGFLRMTGRVLDAFRIHQADIAKVQEWLGHANIATTRIYDHRKTRAEDSPTFKVAY